MVWMLQSCNSFSKEMSILVLLQKASSNKIEYHSFFKKKKKKLSLLLSAVFLWVSFRAAFPLDSFRLESRTKTIKYEGVDTTFDLETP